ncbi:hypothetical protein ABTZ57_07600 [Streptomyces sp. NPDC094048]|uniref:hypothetical protein n=1 Tax=unclassified Streptomyces TaxID=2593676 RepID=UPI0033294EA9
MTPDPTAATRTAMPGSTPAAAPDASARGGFADDTVPRHLARGAIGFGALAGSLALLPVVGPASLLLAPVGWSRCADARCAGRSASWGPSRPGGCVGPARTGGAN